MKKIIIIICFFVSALWLGNSNAFVIPEITTESDLEATVTDVTDIYTNNDGALDDDDVTLPDVQSACANDFHNIGGTDDDIPDAGDFGAATDLDENGVVNETDLGTLRSGITGMVKGAGDDGGYSAGTAGTDYMKPDTASEISANMEIQDNIHFSYGNDDDFSDRYNSTSGNKEIVDASNNVLWWLTPAGGVGSISTADPYAAFYDSDAAGADRDDEFVGSVTGGFSDTTEDAEDSDMALTFMDAGTERTGFFIDGSDYHTYLGVFTGYTGANPSVPPLEVSGLEGIYLDADYGTHTMGIFGTGGTTNIYSTLDWEIGELVVNDSFSIEESGALTDAVEGDNLAELRFEGYHTDDFYLGAVIRAIVDADVGAGVEMPTRFEFATTKDGESTPTLAVTIDSNQNTLFANGLTIGGSQIYYIDSTEADQGAAGNGRSAYDLVTALGTDKQITLVMDVTDTSNNNTDYVFSTSFTFPSNYHIRIENGARFDPDSAKTVTVNSPEHLICGKRQQIKTGDGALAFTVNGKGYCEWWGGKGDNSTNSSAYIQEALTACDLHFNTGIYKSDSTTLVSIREISGDGKHLSIIKPINNTDKIFQHTSGTLSNVTIKDIQVDCSDNYPANTLTTDPGDLSDINYGIYFSDKIENVVIKNCHFSGISGSSIYHVATALSNNLTVENNTFYQGAYKLKVIGLYGPDGATEANAPYDFKIHRNTLTENGPRGHYDASDEDYCGSRDGIHLDNIFHSIVVNNRITDVAGISIRIEQSRYITVSDNNISESGQTGIAIYNYSHYCTVTGNTIHKWGKNIQSYCIREYAGDSKNYIAREFPYVTGPVLPADPSASSWFDENPYSLDNVDNTSIITYDNTDYYPADPNGILPFRGYAAIAITGYSQNSTIIGNTIRGSSDTGNDGGLTYANDFGITVVHSVNVPVAGNGEGAIITGNNISGCNIKPLWFPYLHDPINGTHINGAVKCRDNYVDDETETVDGAIVNPFGVTVIDSGSNKVDFTLDDGKNRSDTKYVLMVNATNPSDVTVTHHEGGDGGTYNFDASHEAVLLIWEGSEWQEVQTFGGIGAYTP